MLRKIGNWLLDNWILTLPLVGILITLPIEKRLPTISIENLKIVYLLFVFFVIIKGMENSGLMRWLSEKMSHGKFSQVKLILLSAGMSMFVTHDLALLTLVPLTMAMDIDDKELMVILETLAANGAAALTPFGNPQNLFMYYFYGMTVQQFISVILPLTVVAIGITAIFALKIKTNHHKTKIGKPTKEGLIYLGLFLLFILVMLKIVPIWLSVIPLLYAVVKDRRSFKIDYVLLLSFLAFFGLSNNLMRLLKSIVISPNDVFVYTIAISQVISNLPPVLLFSGITQDWPALLWASSIGAFGSIMGSLASVIAYRMYIDELKDDGIRNNDIARRSWSYLKRYHKYSFFMMGILILVYLFLR